MGGVWAVLKIVFACAEENEIVRAEPAQERDGLGVGMRGGGRRVVLEFGNRALQPGCHRLEIGNRGAHIGKHAGKSVLHLLKRRQGNGLTDLQMDDAFPRHAALEAACRLKAHEQAFVIAAHLENGMSHKLRGKAQFANRGDYGVEQERHIVVDDIDQQELVAIKRAAVQRYFGLARRAPVEIFESPSGERGEVACIVSLKLGRIRFKEELPGKACGKTSVHWAGQALHNRGKLAASGRFNH